MVDLELGAAFPFQYALEVCLTDKLPPIDAFILLTFLSSIHVKNKHKFIAFEFDSSVDGTWLNRWDK